MNPPIIGRDIEDMKRTSPAWRDPLLSQQQLGQSLSSEAHLKVSDERIPEIYFVLQGNKKRLCYVLFFAA